MDRRFSQVVDLVERGHRPSEAARLVGVPLSKLRRWNALHRGAVHAGTLALGGGGSMQPDSILWEEHG